MSPPIDRPSASRGIIAPPGPRRPRELDPVARWDAAQDKASWGDAAPNGRNGSAHRDRDGSRQPVVIPARRWPRRILIAANVAVAAMLIGVVGVYGYANWRFGQIRRVLLPHVSTSAAPGAPMTILVVGSDSRAGDTGKDVAQFGSGAEVAGQRSDTIMLVHVDPASTKATLMSIPRDLWVPIPGKGYSQRINTAFDSGPDLLVQAVEQNLGIPIDHYVEVNFQSFRQVVDAVGGIKQYFPTPVRDAYSLLKIPAPGCYAMNGDMALSFVRARHYEYRVNGRWQNEAESDLARIKRQQAFVKKTIAKAQASGLTNPLELNRIIGSVTNNLTLDKSFSQNLLLSLGKRFRSLSPDSLPTSTLPTTPAVINGADVLLLQQPAAQQTIAEFLAAGQESNSSTSSTTAPSQVAPSSVRVVVLNGTGRPGEASKAGVDLQRQGFVVAMTRSATNYSYAASVVRYLPGQESKAQLVASAVEGGAQLQADPSVQGGDVELITGLSFKGIIAVPGASGATTPSTRVNPTTPTSGSSTTSSTVYELPGTPAGSVPPAC